MWGGIIMAQSIAKKKPVGKLLITGIASITLYALLFSNQDFVSGTFTRGGLYAFLPIITALIFSFIHGAFTGHFWTVMGVEAAKKKTEVK
jgi:F0F1-type ATP synthase assembly protein I